MKKPLTVSTGKEENPSGGKILYFIISRTVCGKHNEENGEDRNQAIVDNLAENTREAKSV